MVKVEDIQSYGKEHLESVAASASNLQSGVQAIATRLWRLRQEVVRRHQVVC